MKKSSFFSRANFALAGCAGLLAGCAGIMRFGSSPDPRRYLVIDLSGGPSADYYRVSYLPSAPAGGWTDEYKTTKLVMRKIGPGSFRMGSPAGEAGRSALEDPHPVTLTRPFYIGVFQVTQKQWDLVAKRGATPYAGPLRPADNVSYNDIRGASAGAAWPAMSAVDADSFLGRLRFRTGLNGLDLPTEAQWEYACRAGTKTAFNSGENLTDSHACPHLDPLGRYFHNRQDGRGGFTNAHTAVGSYLPNAWGLYDMHGNVWEWCRDWSADRLGTAAAKDPKGAASGMYRVRRGGPWYSDAGGCRSACRSVALPQDRGGFPGLRLVCPADARPSSPGRL